MRELGQPWKPRRGCTVLGALGLSALLACNSSGSGGGTSHGPPDIGPEGGLIDFDASGIPMPWDDAGVARGPGDSGIEPDSGEVADTGFDAAPSCSGVATACSLASSCASVLGCTLQGSCGGLSAECFYQQGDVACISLQGCVWDQGTNSCTGSAWSCNLFNGSASCVGQQGCSWTSMCAGTATPCASIPAASCTTQPGCVLQ